MSASDLERYQVIRLVTLAYEAAEKTPGSNYDYMVFIQYLVKSASDNKIEFVVNNRTNFGRFLTKHNQSILRRASQFLELTKPAGVKCRVCGKRFYSCWNSDEQCGCKEQVLYLPFFEG